MKTKNIAHKNTGCSFCMYSVSKEVVRQQHIRYPYLRCNKHNLLMHPNSIWPTKKTTASDISKSDYCVARA